jgi:amidase
MKNILATFISTVLFTPASFSLAAEITNFPLKLENATISSIHKAIRNGEISCEQLVAQYLERIKKYNLSTDPKPPINAIARITLDVLDQARDLDRKRADANHLQGTLHCIPVLLKDNIDSYDSPSSSGSLALLGNQPTQDAFLTEKLRDAGAIILGKGTMDEFASGLFGISSGNGRTGNVYDTEKNSGGSSSGPAAAVSAAFVTIAIGTDNSGSVRIPAAWNGIVGLRPSTGLISQRGIFPRGNMDGTAGPLANKVEDLARVLNVIAQADPHDEKTSFIPRPQSYLTALKKEGLVGKRIGIVRQIGPFDTFDKMPQDTRRVFDAAMDLLQARGATIVSDIKLREYDLDRHLNQAGELEDINRYLASYPAVRKDFHDICMSKRASILGTPTHCLQVSAGFPKKGSAQYRQVLRIFQKNRAYVETIMERDHLDALLVPASSTGSATYDARAFLNGILASNAGLPGITMNVGYTASDSMPIGVELIGRQFAESTLIELAYGYEQYATKVLPRMPGANVNTTRLDIAAYNNLLTRIGYETYKRVFEASKPDQFPIRLTPEVFRAIVTEQFESQP